jgi:hypothetical protein
MTQWSWAAANCRGTSHVQSGAPLQDAQKCFIAGGSLQPIVAIVSDGAGSATFGGQGAILTCRVLTLCARQHFARTDYLPTDADFEGWVDSVRDRIGVAAKTRMLALREFAATLVCVVSDGQESLIAHVGDGCAALRNSDTGSWVAPSWPDNGEYASTTFFVTDEEGPRLRLTRHGEAINALILFSDGFERLALQFSTRQPFAPLLDKIIAPVASSATSGKDVGLSQKLAAYLNSSMVNSKTDDDKSLILAARK